MGKITRNWFQRFTKNARIYSKPLINKISNQRIYAELTQPARDVPGTSPEGPLKVLTSGTSRGPSGDS